MDEKEKVNDITPEAEKDTPAKWQHTWVDDMKQELEDYLEEQGIYIRQ
ncbi:MAG: hypothetical protein J6A16_05965 [Oscillospiraceae bacterium]|nr:hypothetical protein [Oscillospiraceae bacterium]